MKKLLVLVFLLNCLPLGAAVSCSVVSYTGAGTVQITSGGAVTGTSTSFAAGYVGSQLCVSGTCAFITAYTSSTSIQLGTSWGGTTSGGQTYSISQYARPTTNSTNVVTFVNNFTAGNTLLWGGWIDVHPEQLVSLKDGNGNNFIITPHSASIYRNNTGYLWLGYLPSVGGPAENTIVFADSPNDNLDDVYGAEINCTGGYLAFDNDCFGNAATSTVAPTCSLTTDSNSGVVWSIATATTGFTGIASPYTSTPVSGSGGASGYLFGPTSPVTSTTTPSNVGFGGILAASLKFVPANQVGTGGHSGVGGAAGTNGPSANLTVGAANIFGIKSGTATSETTTAVNTTGATLIVVGCAAHSTSDTISISDSASNSNWIPSPVQFSSGYSQVVVWYAYNPTTSSSHTFTCTSSGSTGLAVGGEWVTNTPKTASVYDVRSSAFSSTASLTVGSIQPKIAGEWFFVFCAGNNTGHTGPTISAGFSVDSSVSTGNDTWMGNLLNTGQYALNPVCALSGDSGINGIMTAFQPAP